MNVFKCKLTRTPAEILVSVLLAMVRFDLFTNTFELFHPKHQQNFHLETELDQYANWGCV